MVGLAAPACSGGGAADRRGAAVPPPSGVVRTSWSTDPWTLGSYSYLGVGATPELRRTLGTPVDGGTLHLAG
ncbi:MAG: FAD-dependent oxidoreductase, partial [Acidobacteria bacterium]|nr:FAD-dependent oxidoreductase [Acidobacteriota bacterium]